MGAPYIAIDIIAYDTNSDGVVDATDETAFDVAHAATPITLNDPTEDGYVSKTGAYEAGCLAAAPTKNDSGTGVAFGGFQVQENRAAYRGYVEWDISSLAGRTLTANPVFKYEGYTSNAIDGEINPLTEEQPSSGGCTDAELWGYIASGTAYIDPFAVTVGVNQSEDLGVVAKADLQTAMDASQSWFAIGFTSEADECQAGGSLRDVFHSEERTPTPTPKPTLYVECVTQEGDPEYHRKFDNDFDDDVDAGDNQYFEDALANYNDLGTIRDNIRTSTYVHLNWPGVSYHAVIIECAIMAEVLKFTGKAGFPVNAGWISIFRHWYLLPGYSCTHFGLDTHVGAFKAMGQGVIFQANSSTHCYNMFFLGGDWTDLANWYFFEPQDPGAIHGNAADEGLEGGLYETNHIIFFWYKDGDYLYGHRLDVDYGNKTVAYEGGATLPLIVYDAGTEEPIPEYWNPRLGMTYWDEGKVNTIDEPIWINGVDTIEVAKISGVAR